MDAPDIRWEDTHLLVVCKPAGMLSQGDASGDASLVDWLRSYVGRHYVGLVHRLDRNTSGLLVVAKRSKAARRLTQQLQDRRLKRSYLAWVAGRVEAPVQWRHHLRKDRARNLVEVVGAGVEGAKPAALTATPMEHREDATLLQLELQTGRSHQIRVQAAAEGHPLLGDRKYGGPPSAPRPALHAFRVRFEHPMSGEGIEVEAPPPSGWAGAGHE